MFIIKKIIFFSVMLKKRKVVIWGMKSYQKNIYKKEYKSNCVVLYNSSIVFCYLNKLSIHNNASDLIFEHGNKNIPTSYQYNNIVCLK